ncbi:MAG: ABC transporter ATP-binding protein [Lachnospiraceae bacterium]|jgi:putative ABC transport system ATP-binding protein|uniref:ABC transporter ATP-binding protein n=1 Tax=uncultured Acetatifactor sp. TaxID=1671927 RepID=UPI002621B231|nr:ABC transporter ATP-binding protein [uncultured Acetatifactor sp.]MCI8789470.1 ABC transporter ATP-binding protein [Lachnospiraceae bacterium]
MSILHLDNLSYAYEKSGPPVLRGITADFQAGKMYAIIGKSGAGKTTLLSLISGLDVCTQGAIFYNGQDLKSINKDRYRAQSIGVIFQSYNLLPGASAVENVVLAMHLSGHKSGDKKAAAYRLLEKVGIDRETADRKTGKLSGGEQQRTGIARALSHNPDILIADEPTGNLDESTQDGIMALLSGLVRNENRCVILVTHSHKVASCADEVLGLSGGRLTTVNQKR